MYFISANTTWPMTEQTHPQPSRAILKVGVKYGLVGSVIAIGLFFVMLWLNENPLVWTAPKLIVYCVLFAAFPLLATLEFRRYYLLGKWKFWQGLMLCVLVYGIISLTTFAVALVAMQLDSELLESYREVSLHSLEANREGFLEQFGEEQYIQTREIVLATTVWDVALDDLFKKIVIGFFLAATIALALSIISSLQTRTPSN